MHTPNSEDQHKHENSAHSKDKPKNPFGPLSKLSQNAKLIWLGTIFGATFGPVLFVWASYPRYLYLPAFILCLIILYGVHVYVVHTENEQSPATQPATARAAITRDNPGRTFEVLTYDLLCNTWTKGARFNEYLLRRAAPAPPPNPGDDPVTSTNDYYEDAISRWLNSDPPIVRIVQGNPAAISENQRATLKKLRDSFERLALQSKGLYHVLVQTKHGSANDDQRPPIREIHEAQIFPSLLPEESSWVRNPIDEEKQISTADSERRLLRNSAGDVIGIMERGSHRLGFTYGDFSVREQFANLANATGIAMFNIPDVAIPLLPDSIRHLCGSPQNRIRPRHESQWVRFGPNLDFAGSQPGDFWFLILHQLAWDSEPSSPLQSQRFFWRGNSSVSVNIKSGHWMTPEVDRHRFYSVLGKDTKTDVVWASVWALDRIIQLLS